MKYSCKLDKGRTGAKGAGPFAISQAGRLKIENFQSQVCACAASTNLKGEKSCAEMGLRISDYEYDEPESEKDCTAE